MKKPDAAPRAVTATQRERWRAEGLLPPVRRRGLGRGRGSITLQSSAADAQQNAVLMMRRRWRTDQPRYLRPLLWLGGLPIMWKRVRADLAALMESMRQWPGAGAVPGGTDDDLDALHAAFLAQGPDGRPVVAVPPALDEEDWPAVAYTLASIAISGRLAFMGDLDTPLGGEPGARRGKTLGATLEAAFGTPAATLKEADACGLLDWRPASAILPTVTEDEARFARLILHELMRQSPEFRRLIRPGRHVRQSLFIVAFTIGHLTAALRASTRVPAADAISGLERQALAGGAFGRTAAPPVPSGAESLPREAAP